MEKIVSDRLTYHDNQILGKGLNGFVFRGAFDQDKTPVAVKRVRLTSVFSEAIQTKEENALKSLDHANLVKFFHAEQDETFRYFVLELCDASLDQTFLPANDPKKYKGPMPTQLDVLRQLATGLEYIHREMLVHRDIKPENILISTREPVSVKLSEFGLCKPVELKNSSSSLTGIKGSQYWMAPEVLDVFNKQQFLKETDRYNTSVSSDIFSLGLVYFAVLTDGLHLFGSKNLISANIMRGKPVNLKKLENGHFAIELVAGMTHLKPDNRTDLTQVIRRLEMH